MVVIGRTRPLGRGGGWPARLSAAAAGPGQTSRHPPPPPGAVDASLESIHFLRYANDRLSRSQRPAALGPTRPAGPRHVRPCAGPFPQHNIAVAFSLLPPALVLPACRVAPLLLFFSPLLIFVSDRPAAPWRSAAPVPTTGRALARPSVAFDTDVPDWPEWPAGQVALTPPICLCALPAAPPRTCRYFDCCLPSRMIEFARQGIDFILM